LNRQGNIAPPRRDEAARKRAAVEMIARHEGDLRRTARRFSLDAGDAEDAYQRALEIALTKAPTTDPRELIRWTQTVTKHEALAVRQSRERLLGLRPPASREGLIPDPLASVPSSSDGPEEQVERREEMARSREALRALKPAELRALGLLAEGYSYAEIGAMTGFSQTKVNRVLAEGRSRFRDLVSRSEDGTRCRELRPLLSALCDGEAKAGEAETMREHLRACAHCRATMRAYRAAPRLAGLLVPPLLAPRSLLGRLQDLLARVGRQVSGTAKLVAVCAAGTAGCMAIGVVPTPVLDHGEPSGAAIERVATGETKAARRSSPQSTSRTRERRHRRPQPTPATGDAPVEVEPVPQPVEYEAPPSPPAVPVSSAAESESSGSAAGEFGP
jgi:RNA polymerase sigma factor (sigma-70 family)